MGVLFLLKLSLYFYIRHLVSFPLFLMICLPYHFPHRVKRLVTGNNKKISFEVFHFSKHFPAHPYTKKGVLYYFLCICLRAGKTHHIISQHVSIVLKKFAEGSFI